MAKRLIKEEVISAETVHKNADIDRQIATIKENIIKKQQEMADLESQIQKLNLIKSQNIAIDAAKNTSNKQNVPVDYEQNAGTENGNKQSSPSTSTPQKTSESLEESGEDYPKETSFVFDNEEEIEENNKFSVDNLDNSILEDDESDEDNIETNESDFFYIFVNDEKDNELFIGKVYKRFDNSKWRESLVAGESDKFGSNTYMNDLSEEDVLEWLKSDYNGYVILIEEDDIDEYIEKYFEE